MQITRSADYALRAAIHLATLPAGRRMSRDSLALAIEAPAEALGKVLQDLVKARLLHSHRGAAGGFSLARDPASINVAQIVESMDGPVGLNHCVMDGLGCSRSSWCPAHTVWRRAQDAMLSVLREASMAQLAAESLNTRGPAAGNTVASPSR
jgi:Rrf2 family protein